MPPPPCCSGVADPWGFTLATVLLSSSAVVQLDYMTALLFQAAAQVPGATAFDPQEPFIAAAITGAAIALLMNLRRAPAAHHLVPQPS